MSDPLKSSIRDALPELTDSMDLVDRHKRGDPAALDLLLRRYQDRLRRIVRIRLGGRLREHLESMDIVQEANIVAARRLADLDVRDHGSILKWLSRIVLNKIRDARDQLDADKRRPEREILHLDGSPSSGSGAGLPLAADDSLPEERVMRAELREIIDDSVTKLPSDYREVILLKDYYDASWEFVAAELGSPTVHAAQELHRRAWIRLRRAVRPRLGELT